jgi:hypothetical protein
MFWNCGLIESCKTEYLLHSESKMSTSNTPDLKKRWKRTQNDILEKAPKPGAYLEEKLAHANLKIDLLTKFIDELIGRIEEDDLK